MVALCVLNDLNFLFSDDQIVKQRLKAKPSVPSTHRELWHLEPEGLMSSFDAKIMYWLLITYWTFKNSQDQIYVFKSIILTQSLLKRGGVLNVIPAYALLRNHLPQRTASPPASMHWPLDLSSRRVGTRFGLTCTRLSYLLLPVPTRGWPPLLPPPPIEPWVPPSFTLLRLQLTTNQPLKTTQPLFCNFSKAGWALSVCHHWVPQQGFKWRMRYCSDSFSGWALLILIRQQRE